jgi:DNA repair exonuclease SbcCD ATPase subunit
MLESGELFADDTLPKLAQGMRDAFGDDVQEAVENARANLQRLANAGIAAKAAFGEGLLEGFEDELGGAANAVKNLETGFFALGRVVQLTFTVVKEGLAGLVASLVAVQGSVLTGFISAVRNVAAVIEVSLVAGLRKLPVIGDEISQKFAEVASTLNKGLAAIEKGAAENAAKSLDRIGESVDNIGAEFVDAAEDIAEYAHRLNASTEASDNAAAKIARLREEAESLAKRFQELVSSGGGTASEFKKIAQEGKRISDAFERLGETAPDALTATIKGAEQLAKTTKKTKEETDDLVRSYDSLVAALRRVNDLQRQQAQERRRELGVDDLAQEQEELTRRQEDLSDQLTLSADEAAELSQVEERLATVTRDLALAGEEAESAMEQLVREQRESAIEAYEQQKANRELAEAMEELRDGTAGLTKEQKEQREQVEGLREGNQALREELEKTRQLVEEFEGVFSKLTERYDTLAEKSETTSLAVVEDFEAMVAACERLRQCVGQLAGT